jgi:hypothetical protein
MSSKITTLVKVIYSRVHVDRSRPAQVPKDASDSQPPSSGKTNLRVEDECVEPLYAIIRLYRRPGKHIRTMGQYAPMLYWCCALQVTFLLSALILLTLRHVKGIRPAACLHEDNG